MNTKSNFKKSVWRRLVTGAVLMLAALPAAVQAQTDYSGTYYIGVYGKNSTSEYSPSSPATNYYLCPTEGWLYYVATNSCQHTPDNGQPFLTSYKCKNGSYDATKAVWVITKHATEEYYYIQQRSTGKYLVFNGKIGNGGANRIRVHLESITAPNEPGDNALFAISTVSTSDDRNGYWLIHPKNASSGYYLNITDGNKDDLKGAAGKTDGPTGVPGYNDNDSKKVGGTIGQWNEANNTSSFYLEDYITRPAIGYNASSLIEITDQTGSASAIYYTTDGTTPTTSSTHYTAPFDFADNMTSIKAIAIVGGEASNVAEFTPVVHAGSTHVRLIQSQDDPWNSTDFHFYMIPGDEEAGFLRVNTTSLFRPSMEWYFLNAGLDGDVQYYYIVNNSNNKYLCYDNTNGVYMETYSADNKFKFIITESPTAGTYNIKPYGYNLNLNKNGHNYASNQLNAISNNSNANVRWKFVLTTDLDKVAPFTASVPAENSYSYYKIASVGSSGYYIVPGATNATTSNSASENMNWYFEEAQAASAADWCTYYHIRNAVTGDYLYFTKDASNYNANPTACLEMRSSAEVDDGYLFTWAKTADATANYYIVPKKLKDVQQGQIGTLQRDNTTLRSNITRGASNYAWTFVESSYTCAQPAITWDGVANGYAITATESDAKIYYTTDGSDPVTSGTRILYNGPIVVANMNVSSVTIRAIAARKGDGTDASAEASVTVNRVETPVITVTNGTVEFSCATGGVAYYYTMDPSNPADPTTTTGTLYSGPIAAADAAGKIIKVIAVKAEMINSEVAATSEPVTFACADPVIRKTSSTTFTIECSFPASAVIHYTTDGTEPDGSSSTYSTAVSFAVGDLPITVKAIAMAAGYNSSAVVTKTITEDLQQGEDGFYEIATADDFRKFVQMANGDGGSERYKITEDISVSGIDPITVAFSGELKGVPKADGSLPVVSDLTHALFNTVVGGKVHDLNFDHVVIGSGTNVGAICNEASGAARIYNCGVLATGSTATTGADGYTTLSACSSTIGGSGYVGGLVGLLDGEARVINCFSYANITGGDYRGGIVGKNNVAYDPSDYKTMVMNCMFYGEITTTGSPTQIAPVYGGEIITNDGDAGGVNNFNYFRIEADYIKNTAVTKTYNCALGAETRFLQRFEFFRHLLNSNRELAAWWITGDRTDTAKVMKWVMEPARKGTSTPYPILKKWGKYPSVVNYSPNTEPYDEAHRNQGRKLTSEGGTGDHAGELAVTIRMGSGNTLFTPAYPTGAQIITGALYLPITDKDTAHFNFNYGKVQLPYYNDVGTKNYTGNRVVTGWKIVSITGDGRDTANYTTGAADVTYTDGELTATPYNFADRYCTKKDLYGTGGSNRIFNQGAYWDVPVGVTNIIIEPYWAKAVYLSDASWDVTYQNSGTDAMVTPVNVATVGGGAPSNSFNGQTVYNTMSAAIGSSALNPNSSHTVYDYAVVLVGNYHQIGGIESGNKPYTVMSVDNNGDNEPDYSFMLRFNGRVQFHPLRYDFLNLIGLGMAQKTTGGTGSYNFGIMQPKYWFESTNTSLFRVTQLEYDRSNRTAAPYIVQGGVIEQWVSGQKDGVSHNTTYFHVGGNAWFKEFQRGTHQDKDYITKHPPVSVTGGDYDEFYLTGLYKADIACYADNAECYINGGRFGTVAGAAMEGIGKPNGADNTGNITWQIQNADIHEFFAGGINDSVRGNLHTIITGSHVDIFCGGPKFGDMSADKTVTTVATGCTFGTFFGAGYGGNSYGRQAPKNHNNIINFPHNDGEAGNDASWNAWLGRFYTQDYNSTYGGVSTQFNYQFLPMSSNVDNVARIFVEYVKFSLATTRNVTSTLTHCTVINNFYGGGSLGKVEGTITSTLDSCTVYGNVFGAGFSASLPTVEVDSLSFKTEPYYYDDLGTYRTGVKGHTTTYKWVHANTVNSTGTAINTTDSILYTTVDISKTNLGSVTTAILTLKGNTKVGTFDGSGTLTSGGNVYGGGDESTVGGNTTVILQDGTRVGGNVFGGGNRGAVAGKSSVKISD